MNRGRGCSWGKALCLRPLLFLQQADPGDKEDDLCTHPPGRVESCGLASGRPTPTLLSRRGGEAQGTDTKQMGFA